MQSNQKRKKHENRKRSRINYSTGPRNDLPRAIQRGDSERTPVSYTHPYSWMVPESPPQVPVPVPGLPAHLPLNILESWQAAQRAYPQPLLPPPEYATSPFLTAPIAPLAPLPTTSIATPAAPAMEAPVPPAPAKEAAVPPAPAKEAPVPVAPVKESPEHADPPATESALVTAEYTRMKDLLRRIIALEFTGRCSQRSVNVFQTICDALSESPIGVVKVMEVLDESFANAVKAGQQQQLMHCWYLVDSVMKLYRDRPEMLHAAVVALPHLLYQYVPWKGSDLAMESWMDREMDAEKYERLFYTWERTIPKELLDAIMEFWNNGVVSGDGEKSFAGSKKKIIFDFCNGV